MNTKNLPQIMQQYAALHCLVGPVSVNEVFQVAHATFKLTPYGLYRHDLIEDFNDIHWKYRVSLLEDVEERIQKAIQASQETIIQHQRFLDQLQPLADIQSASLIAEIIASKETRLSQ